MNIRRKHFLLVSVAGAMIISGISGSLSAVFLNSKNAAVEASSDRYPITNPTEYYESINENSSTLLSDLNNLNTKKRKTTVGYKNMLNDAANGFYVTDPGSVNGSTITTFYSGKSNNGTGGLNREHVWPDSRGGNAVEGDIHMPRPTLNAENGSRGNSFYVEGKCKSSGGWDPAMESFGLESYRGDSARIIFYCAIANTQLTLVDKEDDSTGNKTMGKLSDLLKWNIKYPVQDREKVRNDGAESLQGNRNPFIDHPEYACKIWGNTNSATKEICATEVKKELSSLSYSGTPYTTLYREGETFDPNGLTVTATYDNGSTENVTSSVVWTPSPLTKGTTSVTGKYTYNGVTKQVTVSGITVNDASTPISVTGVTLSESAISVKVGKTSTLTANVIPSNASNKNVSWSTDNAAVATVNNGVVTGVSEGNTLIRVTTIDGSKQATCLVTVTTGGQSGEKTLIENLSELSNGDEVYIATGLGDDSKGVTGYNNSKDATISSNKDEWKAYTVEIKDNTYYLKDGGNYIANPGGNEFKYSETAGGALSLDGDKHVKFGNRFIAINGNYVRCYTSIGSYTPFFLYGSGGAPTPEVKSLSLDKTNISLSMSGTKTATLTPTVTADTGADTTVYWSSNDESIVSVSIASGTKDESVTLTANKAGSAVITAICGSKTATCNVTVESGTVSVTGVSLSDSSKTLVVGGSFTLTATVAPSNATNKNVTWSSSNPSVASVNNGTVTALSSGTTTITVKTVDGNKTATCSVTVNAQVINVTDVELDTNHLDLLVGGTDGTLIATVSPSNASNKEVTWISSDTSVATVEDGVVHAVGNGSAIITVKTVDGDFIDQCTVAVTTPEVIVHPESVSLNINSKSINEGETFSLIATILPENATNKNVSWESSDSSIASVDNGYIKGLNAGTAVITVKTQDGNHTASCTVTVNSITPPPPVEDKVMTELVINKMPNKTIYKVGEPFEQEGLEVLVNYLDGSSALVDDFVIPVLPDSSTAGNKTVKVYYNEKGVNVIAQFDVLYIEETQTINEIKIDGELLKNEYFAGDDLLLYGFAAKATLSDGTVVDATDLVTLSYDLSTPGTAVVTVSIEGAASVTFNVTVKAGEPTATDEAVDFTYEYIEKIPEEIESVSLKDWAILEHYFNTLDEDAQAVLRNYVTEFTGVKAGAEDNLLEVLTNYDEVILAKKSQGFTDFIGRNPQEHKDEEKSNFNWLPVIIAGSVVLVLTIGLIILVVALNKKKRKLAN